MRLREDETVYPVSCGAGLTASKNFNTCSEPVILHVFILPQESKYINIKSVFPSRSFAAKIKKKLMSQPIYQGNLNFNIQEEKNMKKNYRLTIDFEIDIDEKVRVPGEIAGNGECTAEMLEKTQHIMDAFFKEPRVMDNFIKNRLNSRILCNEGAQDAMAEVLDLHEEKEFMSLLAPHIPPGTVPYLLGVFCGDKNFTIPYDEDETLIAMVH